MKSANYDAIVTLGLHQGLAIKDTFKLFSLSPSEREIYLKIIMESLNDSVVKEDEFAAFKAQRNIS